MSATDAPSLTDPPAPAEPLPLDYQPPQPPSLGHLAARGFAWTVLNTVATKVVGLGSQVVLAWLLLQKDFGTAALATTVAGFAGLLRDAGLQQVLIHRQRKFHLWANPVFWLSTALSLLSSGLLVAVAPAAAKAFDAPGIVPLIWILAASGLVGNLGLLPGIRLQIEMRFGALSILNATLATLTAVLAAAMAWAGAGAYALVVPVAAFLLVRVAALWWLAPVPLRWSPQVRRWRYLWGDSAVLMATLLAGTLIAQGDYLALGLFHDEATVGVYFFAFALSTQTIQLLTGNLTAVLFPALGRLGGDPRRQIEAFMSASRLIAAVGVPACLLQAIVAQPLVRLLFGANWLDAVPIVQLLSVGATASLAAGQVTGLFQAQGRFATQLRCMLGFGVLFLTTFLLGAASGGAVTVAAAAAGTYLVSNLLGMYIGVWPGGIGLGAVVSFYLRVMAVATVGVAPAAALVWLLPEATSRPGAALVLAVTGGTGLLGSTLAFRLLEPRLWEVLIGRVAALLPRGRP